MEDRVRAETDGRFRRGRTALGTGYLLSGPAAERSESRETSVANSHEFRYDQPVTAKKMENFGVLSKNVGKMTRCAAADEILNRR